MGLTNGRDRGSKDSRPSRDRKPGQEQRAHGFVESPQLVRFARNMSIEKRAGFGSHP
ncbi:hypothetical protein D3C83_138660 [compost metagenome]